MIVVVCVMLNVCVLCCGLKLKGVGDDESDDVGVLVFNLFCYVLVMKMKCIVLKLL